MLRQLGLLVLLMLGVSCARGQLNSSRGGITVLVLDSKGSVLKTHPIEVVYPYGEVATAYTNDSGLALFQPLPYGEYRVGTRLDSFTMRVDSIAVEAPETVFVTLNFSGGPRSRKSRPQVQTRPEEIQESAAAPLAHLQPKSKRAANEKRHARHEKFRKEITSFRHKVVLPSETLIPIL